MARGVGLGDGWRRDGIAPRTGGIGADQGASEFPLGVGAAGNRAEEPIRNDVNSGEDAKGLSGPIGRVGACG